MHKVRRTRAPDANVNLEQPRRAADPLNTVKYIPTRKIHTDDNLFSAKSSKDALSRTLVLA